MALRPLLKAASICLFLCAGLFGLLRSPSALAQEAPPTAAQTITATATITGTVTTSPSSPSLLRGPTAHLVQPGETLDAIATRYGVTAPALGRANSFTPSTTIQPGFLLLIPAPRPAADSTPAPAVQARGTITQRMTPLAQAAPPDSPFAGVTWLTYYGRPTVEVMGILGEYDIDELTARLKEQAAAYDAANGPALGVQPAFHLVHGMAAKAPGDGSHLLFLDEETVLAYITKAQEENFAVILDVQIGTLSPARSISDVLPYLAYENVHLAIDPEFAVVHPGQRVPGNPIGFVTAQQVNDVQQVMADYLRANDLPGPRLLLVHQFQDSMVVDKAGLDWQVPGVALVLSVDGWGPPWGKISKYSVLTDESMGFLAFKLFYRWDEPLLNPAQALGEEPYADVGYIELTPNLIIYQ